MATGTLEVSDLIGKPFKYGGRGPDFYDCYGLVMEMQRRYGVVIPDYRSPQVQDAIQDAIQGGMPLWTPCEEKPGSVAAIRVGRYISHVATILPFGKLIHTWESSGGVCIERTDEWKRRIVGFYEFKK